MKFGAQRKITGEQIEELKARRAHGLLVKTLMKDYKLLKVSICRCMKG